MKPLKLRGYIRDPAPITFIFSSFLISTFICEEILSFSDNEMSNLDFLITSSIGILSLIGGYLFYEYFLVPNVLYGSKDGQKKLNKLMAKALIISGAIILFWIIRYSWFD